MKVYVVLSAETSVVNSMCDDIYVEAVFKNLEDAQKFIQDKDNFYIQIAELQ